MWINIDDAIRIYARMLRARLGSIRGAKAARDTANHLRAKGDWSGVEVWEAVATELMPDEVPRDPRVPNCRYTKTRISYKFSNMPYSLETVLPTPKHDMKGDIFIRCPTTGQPVPTGLDTETVVFETLPTIDLLMRCPACQQPRVWNWTKAWIVKSAKLT